jgi:clan AA aspartic protease
MKGRVSRGEAILAVIVRSPGRDDLTVECVVDTGFAGYLTLPPQIVQTLRLSFAWETRGRLADGNTIKIGVYNAIILWDGREQAVRVLATGARPLLGTLLLDGHTLTIDFTEGGAVSVQPL